VTVSSDESLQQIGQALVSAASSVGLDLSAVLLPSTSGTELSLSGATGSNSFSVSGTLSGGLGFNLVQSGAAASYSVNQVDNTSPTNTIENGLAPGVTLNLLSTGSTTMTVSPDYSQVTSQVSKLVNDVMSVINTINKVAGKGGPLEGNAALLNLAQNLVSDLSQTNSALPAGYQSLLNLGLSVSWSQSTGETVSFDSSAFQQALQQNPQAVTGLFTGAGGSPGIANTVSNFLNGFLAPTTGIVASAQSGITSQEKTLSQEQASLQQLIQQEQTEADNQFIAELQTMLKEALLQQSLSAQFATANGSRSGSGPSANAVP
jgi:flagellar hook-associated protein 2